MPEKSKEPKKPKKIKKPENPKKPEKVRCIGKTKTGQECSNYGNDSKFCKKHSYQSEYTKEEFDRAQVCKTCQSVKLLVEGMKSCSECHNYAQKKRERLRLSLVNDKSKLKCSGISRGNKSCIKLAPSDGKFCKFHEFQSSYSKEQMENLVECSGCLHMHISEELGNNGKGVCDNCRGRKKVGHSKLVGGGSNKESKKKCVFTTVKGIQCSFNGVVDIQGQMYCKPHEKFQLDEIEAKLQNKVKCKSKYSCSELLPKTYMYNSCEKCLKKEQDVNTKRKEKMLDDEKIVVKKKSDMKRLDEIAKSVKSGKNWRIC